jgi:GntR family transcriptional regulator
MSDPCHTWVVKYAGVRWEYRKPVNQEEEGPMEPVDRSLDRPVYKQIADILRARIDQAVYAEGESLPSENVLAKTYSVNRRTVQNAYKELIAEGKVRAAHGSGYFVTTRPPVRRLAFDRFARRHREEGKAAFTVEMAAAGKSYDVKNDVEMLALEIGTAPESIAARLQVGESDAVLIRSRRYLVEGTPLQVATSYVPMDVADGTPIMLADTGPGGIYARIEEKGFMLSRFTEDIRFVPADDRTASLLNLGTGSFVIHLVRTAFSGNRVVEVCDTHMLPAAFELSYELPA